MKFWLIIPAAGIGTRMSTDIPKQYLKIHGKTILEHTLINLLAYPRFEKIIVMLRENDPYWTTLPIHNHSKITTAIGDTERYLTVMNGLTVLDGLADAQDWVLIHDAVRPCVDHADIDKLIAATEQHPVGGILGAPSRDTIKQINSENEIVATLDRNVVWQAFSPQMIRYGLLKEALQSAVANKQHVTDDASAVELLGKKPLLIAGQRSNIKITESADLKLAEFYLANCC